MNSKVVSLWSPSQVNTQQPKYPTQTTAEQPGKRLTPLYCKIDANTRWIVRWTRTAQHHVKPDVAMKGSSRVVTSSRDPGRSPTTPGKQAARQATTMSTSRHKLRGIAIWRRMIIASDKDRKDLR